MPSDLIFFLNINERQYYSVLAFCLFSSSMVSPPGRHHGDFPWSFRLKGRFMLYMASILKLPAFWAEMPHNIYINIFVIGIQLVTQFGRQRPNHGAAVPAWLIINDVLLKTVVFFCFKVRMMPVIGDGHCSGWAIQPACCA